MKTGVNTSTIIRVKKPKPIQCDCKKCSHSTLKNKILYCKYFDLINPRRKSCSRYIEVVKSCRRKEIQNLKPKEVAKFPWEL